ncbi:ATP-binding protein [Nitrosomonas sp. Nm166]|uniref:ATP-binding protein n=1 Tax=Nitrosomonas sp. Nm166 TaxID=1881054 RepID=UPI0008F095F4|nr:ATP-binding protein [Nitrosomonas sp. Nm166]SFF03730.1 hypothetical protein SAMN05428977_104417 [Nitrosomonas sp. Nm166]
MNKIFQFGEKDILGRVISVDTATAVIEIDDLEKLRCMQVNRLVALESNAGQHLIGLIEKITRKAIDALLEGKENDAEVVEQNLVRISLIGTLFDKRGTHENVFTRTVESVPRINAACFPVEGESLTRFMQVIAQVAQDDLKKSLLIGNYTLDERAEAYLHGDRFFQRHAVVVGSTGSGKSWTTARLLEQVANLPQGNAIVFDIHGEYNTMQADGFRHFRIAGSSDLEKKTSLDDGVLYLPYWLLSYEALVSMLVDRSDQNAPNQAMIMSRAIIKAKQKSLENAGQKEIIENFTIDSPVPFNILDVEAELNSINTEMVTGSSCRDKQGDFHGKLSRLIARLEAKISDRRLGFLFKPPTETSAFEWLNEFATVLIAGRADQKDGKGGVKIIDFSEVPSDILPLMVSLIAKLAFSIHQWQPSNKRHPIALFCDEAHLYIPDTNNTDAAGEVSVDIFERIAKEGRKYGVGLVVISQRPSEVNKTVLSQCNNLLAMRLTNGEDQSVIKKLLPDSLGGFGDVLPILDIGEALIVGDASLLPSRIRIKEPSFEPSSATIPFWKKWSDDIKIGGVSDAVNNWRRQSMKRT